MVETNILLAESTNEAIYYLNEEGKLSIFYNQSETPDVLLTNRQNDYCWGLI